MSCQGRLDWQRGLITQDSQKRCLVLYATSGTNAIAAIIIDREGAAFPFFANAVMYHYTNTSRAEAVYLCAFLNSPPPNKLIKHFQASGLLGAARLQKILEIPLPAYAPSTTMHPELAALAQAPSEKVRAFLAAQNFDRQGGNMDSRLLGRFRSEVRAHIRLELAEIDKRIASLCSAESAGCQSLRRPCFNAPGRVRKCPSGSPPSPAPAPTLPGL